ncbi:MAG: STAS/SEC14 domain-containing protein [Alphaproteobacteria bacterium]|nr:MAG: STAS/SEC14 domain-containing protein [Alphaproteobacteria bacterium]
MIEIMPQSSGNVIGIKAGGRLSDADYRQILIPCLEERLKQHRKLNILFYMDETFTGWDLEAAWDDASYGLRHRADFDRIAVVGAPPWVEWCIRLIGFLMKGEIRVFPAEQLDQAWAWIKTTQ